jgi:pre-rRNA-processing protein TSR3
VSLSTYHRSDIEIHADGLGGGETVPYVIATNPVNYGKRKNTFSLFPFLYRRTSSYFSLISFVIAYKLNCVEATAAALYITGFDSQAELLLSKFSWGHSFWEVNGQIIERYKQCTTPESVIEMQQTIIREMEKQDDERREFSLSFSN